MCDLSLIINHLTEKQVFQMNSNENGKFIVLGGLDQTGKSTQAQKLVNYLNEHGKNAILTHEPTGTELGSQLKKIMSEQIVSAETMRLLFTAARQHHLETVIRPAIARGDWVVCDRYFESTYAYQGAMGISDDSLLTMHQLLKHDQLIDHQFIFVGKIGARSELDKDHLDNFCDQKRSDIQNRLITYSKLHPENTTVIKMSNQSQSWVLHQILAKIFN